MRVAICITTHNRRAELARTLAQLALLDPAPDEILIVADGCTDGTADFVRTEYPRATLIIHTKAHGSIASRNAMARAANADIFLSLDDDSYPLEADAIARIRTLFQNNARLAVAEFPQRTNESPASLTQTEFGTAHFIASYANSGAAVRREIFIKLGDYFGPFFHAYEEPDFALRCCAASWQVRYEPCLIIRHHWSSAQRNEKRTHQRHARNELWSAVLRCPMPWLLVVAPFRVMRQFFYALRRGWALGEPVWWWQFLRGIGICIHARAPLPWRSYLTWMRLARAPHDDAEKWARDLHQ